jgi:hypothetical protein
VTSAACLTLTHAHLSPKETLGVGARLAFGLDYVLGVRCQSAREEPGVDAKLSPAAHSVSHTGVDLFATRVALDLHDEVGICSDQSTS